MKKRIETESMIFIYIKAASPKKEKTVVDVVVVVQLEEISNG